MKYFSSLLIVLASSPGLLIALPQPQALKLNPDANERANDGQKGIENIIKTEEALALSEAGCAGAIINGAACEKIDVEFQAKLAEALGKDLNAAAAADAGAAKNAGKANATENVNKGDAADANANKANSTVANAADAGKANAGQVKGGKAIVGKNKMQKPNVGNAAEAKAGAGNAGALKADAGNTNATKAVAANPNANDNKACAKVAKGNGKAKGKRSIVAKL